MSEWQGDEQEPRGRLYQNGRLQPNGRTRNGESPRSRGRGSQDTKRRRPEVTATVITVIGLFIVAVLAVQASGSAPANATAGSSPSTAPHVTASVAPSQTPTVPPIPPASGNGKRVVYSISQQRVWLVDTNGALVGTFTGIGGTQVPSVGSHRVIDHAMRGFGSDGVFIHYVTYWGFTGSGYALAFNTTDLSSPTSTPTAGPLDPDVPGSPPPTSNGKTGAIRFPLQEANLLYHFASLGAVVYVVS